MSAEVLRRVAKLMRERAEAATPGPWATGRSSDDAPAFVRKPGWWVVASHTDDGDATHISSWHPAVALVVADWLDHEAEMHEWEYDTTHALTVARAYLGGVHIDLAGGDSQCPTPATTAPFVAHPILTPAGAWNEYADSLDHLPTWMEAREAGFLITRAANEEVEQVENDDPYDEPVGVFEGNRWHMHSEPVCAWPDCQTYLTREQMRRAAGTDA